MKNISLCILFLILALSSMPSNIQAASPHNVESENTSNTPAILTYGITTDPDHLNPFQATSADSRVVLFNIFEGLLKPSAHEKLIPAIAKSYTMAEDARSYTFVLRDVLFHNAQKVTPQDVKYSIEQAINYKMTGMDAIKSVEIIDDNSITINLHNPDSEFYYSMTTAIVPNGYDNHNLSPIGTGPFKFVSYSPQQQLVLAAHEAYWNTELPKIDTVIFKVKADINTLVLDLQAGSLQAGALNTTLAEQLNPNDFEIFYENTNSVQMLCLNNKFKPLSDVLVRRAISYVVNFDEISLLAHLGHATRAGSPVIPSLKSVYNTSLDDSYAKNIDLAKQLLAEAGYANGFKMAISVPSTYQQHIDTAQVIVNQLAEINISASIKLVDWPTWLSKVYTDREYEATVISVDGITLSARSYLFRYESTSSTNFINYSNAEYDALFQKSLTLNDAKERTEIYHKLQKILSDDAASVFICDISSPKIFKKGIKGFKPYPLYVFDASTIYFE